MKMAYHLCLAFCLGTLLMGFGVQGKAAENQKFKTVTVEEFEKLRVDKSNVLLDVRRPTEFKFGHIGGATCVDWLDSKFEKKVSALEKNKTYLVYCAVGGRSAKACEKMVGLGFTHVYNLKGGIQAWERANKPLEK